MTTEETTFVRGNEHLARLMSDPPVAHDVAEARADIHEMDRIYAKSLAMVRKAGKLTQTAMAERLGVGQGAVSRLENRDDMLLSTLFGYLVAAGADEARIVVTVRGREIDLDLASLAKSDRHGDPKEG